MRLRFGYFGARGSAVSVSNRSGRVDMRLPMTPVVAVTDPTNPIVNILGLSPAPLAVSVDDGPINIDFGPAAPTVTVVGVDGPISIPLLPASRVRAPVRSRTSRDRW